MEKTKYSSSVEINNEIIGFEEELLKMIKEDCQNKAIKLAIDNDKNNFNVYRNDFIDTTKDPESNIDLDTFFRLKERGVSKYIFTISAW